ncbi:MAG: hypothetical protein WAM70_19365, partial [Pyrinomonadaceae bacterium]
IQIKVHATAGIGQIKAVAGYVDKNWGVVRTQPSKAEAFTVALPIVITFIVVVIRTGVLN